MDEHAREARYRDALHKIRADVERLRVVIPLPGRAVITNEIVTAIDATLAACETETCPKCGQPSVSPPAEVYCVECATEGYKDDAIAHLRQRLAGTVDALREVTEALDDAIMHNVNATEHDPAGWTQEDYDRWDAARARGEDALGGRYA